jgi:putative ABC transport system permease protein
MGKPTGFSDQARLAIRLALREMRGGLKGFYIFLACIMIGTAAIAGVNSVSRAMTDVISSEGRNLLAADIRFELKSREATSVEEAFLNRFGKVSKSANLRSMARLADGSDQALVELKAVDGAYPLYGSIETLPSLPLSDLLGIRDGVHGAIAAPLLLDRLGLKVGDRLKIGETIVAIRARLMREPDQLSDGFGFAPRLMISRDALPTTGLVRTGSLVDHAYKIRFSDPAITGRQVREAAEAEFPESGWSIRGAANAAPALTSNIKRFSQFLTLVGLAALATGGVGVANAVNAYLDGKRGVIATFKCLGAPGRLIVAIYLIQIMLIAGLGVLGGLVLGAIIPMVAQYVLIDILPLKPGIHIYPAALLLAALFGLLTAFAFAILPLGRARRVAASSLMRSQSMEELRLGSLPFLLLAGFALACLAGLALYSAEDRNVAAYFLGATGVAFLVLRLVAAGVASLARRVPVLPFPALRLAVGNIHRPGALTASVVLSLGLGLTLLSTLSQIDGNLRRGLTSNLSDRAANFFFVDIQGKDLAGFEKVVADNDPRGKIAKVPMLRGRIMKFNGEDVARRNVPASARWVLQGDRGITYAQALPDNASVEEGAWWKPDHDGEPLVSFAGEEARELGLKIGDTVTVNVLGRNITARIANFRKVAWQSMSINFLMVFSPNTFKGAPHAWLATLSDPQADAETEARVLRAVTNAYPAITSIRVKDALDIANRLVGQIATAVRAAAAVALISSVLVLAGALAAGNRARIHDAVVMKTLGATRRTLMTAFVLEYALIGLATALFALLASSAAAWYAITAIMTLPYALMPDVAVLTIVIALFVTVGIGLMGTWRVLGVKAAPVLREL